MVVTTRYSFASKKKLSVNEEASQAFTDWCNSSQNRPPELAGVRESHYGRYWNGDQSYLEPTLSDETISNSYPAF